MPGLLDVEWKMVYVGSADDQTHDQELESVMVGPVTQGKYKFVFQVRNSTILFTSSDTYWKGLLRTQKVILFL